MDAWGLTVSRAVVKEEGTVGVGAIGLKSSRGGLFCTSSARSVIVRRLAVEASCHRKQHEKTKVSYPSS